MALSCRANRAERCPVSGGPADIGLNASYSHFDPQRSFENSALDAFRLEDHVNCEDNRATRAPAGVPGGRLQRRTE